jgi:hypothetical protein
MKLAYARIVTQHVPALGRFYRELIGLTPGGNLINVHPRINSEASVAS